MEMPGIAGEGTPLGNGGGADKIRLYSDKPAFPRGLTSRLLPVRTLLTGTTRRLGPLLLLEKGEMGTLTTLVIGQTHGRLTRHAVGMQLKSLARQPPLAPNTTLSGHGNSGRSRNGSNKEADTKREEAQVNIVLSIKKI
ncbi:hypothetical protein E2C01_043525 [Portunus trituberculatus]|uniref:Uncharacterized protein n=1 Tax=Portunus trituberculatus TaxID=210409 RepID=A0A5B7FQI3_PORTR|nr:hypothetical protein [Portunus trituberculatus]